MYTSVSLWCEDPGCKVCRVSVLWVLRDRAPNISSFCSPGFGEIGVQHWLTCSCQDQCTSVMICRSRADIHWPPLTVPTEGRACMKIEERLQYHNRSFIRTGGALYLLTLLFLLLMGVGDGKKAVTQAAGSIQVARSWLAGYTYWNFQCANVCSTSEESITPRFLVEGSTFAYRTGVAIL